MLVKRLLKRLAPSILAKIMQCQITESGSGGPVVGNFSGDCPHYQEKFVQCSY